MASDLCIKNGSNGARTHDLSRVRRTLIPAELCFHETNYSTKKIKVNDLYFHSRSDFMAEQAEYSPSNQHIHYPKLVFVQS